MSKLYYIWGSELLSSLSSSIVQFAIIWWLAAETGSTTVLAYAYVAAILPQTLLGLFIGVYVDRWKKKRILILSDFSIAFFSAVLGVLFYLDQVEISYIYALLALRSIGNTFYLPALQAVIPLLAEKEKFMRISAINQTIQAFSNTAGPALGAILVVTLNMQTIILFDVVGAFIACIVLSFTQIGEELHEKQFVGNVIKELKDGFQVIIHNRTIAYIILISSLLYIIFMPLNALYPILVFDYFDGGAIEMGIIETLFGVAMILGGAVAASIRIKKITLLNLSYIGIGLPLIFTGILPPTGIFLFIIIFLIAGFFVPLQSSPLTALVQTHITQEKLGRVFAIMGALNGLSVVTILCVGYLADAIGMSYTFMLAGILISGMGVISLLKLKKRKEDTD